METYHFILMTAENTNNECIPISVLRYQYRFSPDTDNKMFSALYDNTNVLCFCQLNFIEFN